MQSSSLDRNLMFSSTSPIQLNNFYASHCITILPLSFPVSEKKTLSAAVYFSTTCLAHMASLYSCLTNELLHKVMAVECLVGYFSVR